jgi:LAO/AO transport system kinase
MSLAEKILKGDDRSAARLISLIEEGEQEGYKELRQLLPHTGRAHVVGVTGPAGAGKSTIIGRLALQFIARDCKVGIIAIDPTSLRSQGALLGDRLRMKEVEKAGKVFIRSMADRGYPGGVARAAVGATYVLEGLGKDLIIIESVGAGQSDKDLFFLADTVITLLTPDYGDDIQLLKAGLLEIGDIIVINKMDKPGAEEACRQLDLHFGIPDRLGWPVPVLCTRADKNEGVDEVVRAIQSHWQFLTEEKKRDEQKREKITSFTSLLLKEELWKRFMGSHAGTVQFKRVMEEVQAGREDPYTAVDELLLGHPRPASRVPRGTRPPSHSRRARLIDSQARVRGNPSAGIAPAGEKKGRKEKAKDMR